MKLAVKGIPYGDLPYQDLTSASKMMQKLFSSIPYLPNLPKYDAKENLSYRTFSNIPSIKETNGKYVITKDYDKLKKDVSLMDKAFNSYENIEDYKFDAAFLDLFFKFIERNKPRHAVINFLGVYTISRMLEREEIPLLITDKLGRKFLAQVCCLHAIWIVKKIKEISPETVPIIVYEEPKFNTFGALRRANDNVDKDQIIITYAKIIEKMHENGALVCVQCFEKCDWQIPLDAGIDILSFDAYTNPNNLAIIPDKINDFLAHGGYINWGIVPVKSENIIKGLSVDGLYKKLINTFENTIGKDVSAKLIYNRATISVQGNMDNLPIMFAEKALIITEQLSKKIPTLS